MMAPLQMVVVLALVALASADTAPAGTKATAPAQKATTKTAGEAPEKATSGAPKALHYPSPSKLTGDMTLKVSDVAPFLADPAVASIFQEALATCTGVPAVDVKILGIEEVKRQSPSSGARRLDAGSLKVYYQIVDKSGVLVPSNVASSGSAMTFEANLALQKGHVQGHITRATFSLPAKVDMPKATTATSTAAPTPAPTPAPTLAPTPAPTPVPTTASASTSTPASAPTPAPVSAPASVPVNPCAVPVTNPSTKTGANPAKLPAAVSKVTKAMEKVKNNAMEKVKPLEKRVATAMDNAKPWEKTAGIAAASVAGAAAVAGGIAGIVESQAAPKAPQVDGTPKPKIVTVKVPVRVPVQPAAVSVLYDDSTQKPDVGMASASTHQQMLLNAAAMLFVGCVVVGVSGLVYYRVGQKKRATQVHAFTELPAEEA